MMPRVVAMHAALAADRTHRLRDEASRTRARGITLTAACRVGRASIANTVPAARPWPVRHLQQFLQSHPLSQFHTFT